MSRRMTIALKQLSECPEHLETVGRWIYEEWWSKRCDSPEVVLNWLRSHTKLDTVPYSVIALAEANQLEVAASSKTTAFIAPNMRLGSLQFTSGWTFAAEGLPR